MNPDDPNAIAATVMLAIMRRQNVSELVITDDEVQATPDDACLICGRNPDGSLVVVASTQDQAEAECHRRREKSGEK